MDDGGQAFPKTGSFHEQGSSDYDSLDQKGMSLRDWFAGQVLVGMGTWSPGSSTGQLDSPETAAERASFAYRQADAMIAARKAGGE